MQSDMWLENMKKEILILGSIGNTARQNRDNMRVLNRGGADVRIEISHRQGSSIDCENVEKEIVVLGDISPDNKHQWSVVFSRVGISRSLQARDYKYPICVVRRYETDNNNRSDG